MGCIRVSRMTAHILLHRLVVEYKIYRKKRKALGLLDVRCYNLHKCK